LVGKPEVKRLLRIPRQRLEDIIKMDPRKTEMGDVEWIHLDQNRDWW
jgi:hypothetical protein